MPGDYVLLPNKIEFLLARKKGGWVLSRPPRVLAPYNLTNWAGVWELRKMDCREREASFHQMPN